MNERCVVASYAQTTAMSSHNDGVYTPLSIEDGGAVLNLPNFNLDFREPILRSGVGLVKEECGGAWDRSESPNLVLPDVVATIGSTLMVSSSEFLLPELEIVTEALPENEPVNADNTTSNSVRVDDVHSSNPRNSQFSAN